MKRCKCKKIMANVNPNLMCWACMKKEGLEMIPVIGPDTFSRLVEETNAYWPLILNSGIKKVEFQYHGILSDSNLYNVEHFASKRGRFV